MPHARRGVQQSGRREIIVVDPTELLKRSGWTTGELSRRLNIPASTVTGWVRRGYWPEVVVEFLADLALAVESVKIPERALQRKSIERRQRDPDGAAYDSESES